MKNTMHKSSQQLSSVSLQKLILHHLFPLLQDVSHTRSLSPLTNSVHSTLFQEALVNFHFSAHLSFPLLSSQTSSRLPSTSEMYPFQLSRSKFPKRILFLLIKNSNEAVASLKLLWGSKFGCKPTWVNVSTGHLVAKNPASWEAGILGPRSKRSDLPLLPPPPHQLNFLFKVFPFLL